MDESFQKFHQKVLKCERVHGVTSTVWVGTWVGGEGVGRGVFGDAGVLGRGRQSLVSARQVSFTSWERIHVLWRFIVSQAAWRGWWGWGGGRASETEHLLCSRLAFRESDRETLTLENLEV